MNKQDDQNHEAQAAEELDAQLTRLQNKQPAALGTDHERLAGGLHRLKENNPPDPAFRSALAKRLRAQALTKTNPTRTLPKLFSAGENFMNANRLLLYAGAGALAIILAMLIFGNNLPTVAILPTPTHTALAPTQERTPTQPGTASPTPLPFEITAAPPTAAPLILPTAAPALPILANWLNAGFGGAQISPFHYSLQAALPDGPASATAYLQRLPEYGMDVLQIKELAAGLGLDAPEIYQLPAVGVFIAIQGSREVVFNAALDFHYIDRAVLNLPDGRYYYPEALVPAAETVAQAAEDFLEQTWFMTLLNSRYMIEVNRESARFYRVMDGGMRVDPPFAVVTVSPEGRVAILEMHVAYMDAVGQYDLIPAAEAWALVSDPAAQARISVQVTPAVDGNPPVWGRRYKAGETVRITAPLTIYAGPTPYIRVNGLSIHGTTAQLTSLANAYQVLQQATMDTRTPIQIWGMVGPDGSTLELEGYAEVRQPGMWVGVLRRDGETRILTTDDGLTLELPDLPDDLPDGLRVFVEGESANNRLEWTVIQQAVEGGPGPGLSLEVIIDQVELGYLAPDGLMLRQNGINDFALQSLQPVWRFSGFTAAGDAVSIYVQAVK